MHISQKPTDVMRRDFAPGIVQVPRNLQPPWTQHTRGEILAHDGLLDVSLHLPRNGLDLEVSVVMVADVALVQPAHQVFNVPYRTTSSSTQLAFAITSTLFMRAYT